MGGPARDQESAGTGAADWPGAGAQMGAGELFPVGALGGDGVGATALGFFLLGRYRTSLSTHSRSRHCHCHRRCRCLVTVAHSSPSHRYGTVTEPWVVLQLLAHLLLLGMAVRHAISLELDADDGILQDPRYCIVPTGPGTHSDDAAATKPRNHRSQRRRHQRVAKIQLTVPSSVAPAPAAAAAPLLNSRRRARWYLVQVT